MNLSKILRTGGMAALAGIVSLWATAAEESEASKPAPVGSIRPTGKVAKADLPGLTKISFADAMKVATTTVPGSVITGELEVEDGNLQYSFDVVGDNKKVTEVEIDAGNGKVLDTDTDDDDDDDKPDAATPATAAKKG
jgi:hypothetical protein